MKERPILFKPEMIQAIMDGSKTMTRRVVKPTPPEYIDSLHGYELRKRAPYQLECFETGMSLGVGFLDEENRTYKCKYGQVGDRLWVKEATYHPLTGQSHVMQANEGLIYAIDRKTMPEHYKYVSPLFMPRAYSRILLEITNVRVERLNNISIIDALAEGIRCPECGYTHKDAQLHMDHSICVNKWLKECKAGRATNHGAIDAFQKLWESINGEGSWQDNPWLWVIEFNAVTE